MTSCRVFRSAELGSSDHRLLAFSLRLRTKACKQTTPTKRFNTDALSNQAIASKYAVEVHNRYSLLQNLDPGDQNIGDAWETFKCAIHESAAKILGKPHAPKKKPGSPSLPSTLLMIEELPDYVAINLKSND